MDKGMIAIIGGTFVILGIFFAVSMNSPEQKLNASFEGEDKEIVSEEGVHWHPELAIYVKGQKQELPTNLGIGEQYRNSKYFDPIVKMAGLHTHAPDGILHYEMASGPVRKGHLRLGNFFELWGKTFTKDQLFDYKNGDGGTVKMTVNGQENTDFERYLVKDGDKIEIRYE